MTEWGEQQADHYIQDLDTCFERLVENPKLGRERSDIKETYRSIPVASHVVFYRITHSTVEIIGIPHQREEPENHLSESPDLSIFVFSPAQSSVNSSSSTHVLTA